MVKKKKIDKKIEINKEASTREKFTDARLKEILLKGNYITEDDVKGYETFGKEKNLSLADYLVQNNLVTKDLVGQAIAESFGIPYADLNSSPASSEKVQKIPEDISRKLGVVIFGENKNEIQITTDSPNNINLVPELKKVFKGKKLKILYSLTEDIDNSFIHYQKPLETRFSKIIEGKNRIAPELLDEIFDDAVLYRASDIHFEPLSEYVLVRFRVDGVLHEAGRIPKEYYENVLNRIKVQSGLRIDEHFVAQDGSIRYEKGEKVVDLRTSIVPTVEGEKVVLRVLAAYIQGLSLSHLGLSSSNQKFLEEATEKPFGMILVAGPTGSGKTTTLYSLLKLVNKPDVNITTIEDPVEYRIRGINQIQVNSKTNLTFAKGLRSIVRQDPDIILVGEIRDEETAEIAVNAALTGHLLYSSFHANDAATVVPRLLDMGIEPFLLASTLQVIVAQRLVRKICDQCRYSVTKTGDDFENPQMKQVMKYFEEKTVTLYQGKKCDACGHTGYIGRTAIFEFIPVNTEMQELILNSPSTQEIWELARKQGSRTLFEDGMDKVKEGITTIEELLRVAEPPKNIK